MRNRAELLLTYYAASMAGAVVVPVNPLLAEDEWRHILANSGAPVLFTSADLIERTDLADNPPCQIVTVGPDQRPGGIPVEQWVAEAGGSSMLPVLDDDAPGLQMYTSGTTGRPKGAVFAHRAISEVMHRWLVCGLRLDPGERLYMAMPACLAAGMLTVSNGVQNGAEIVFASKFVPEDVITAFHTGQIAATALAPTMIQRCVDVPGADQREYPHLRWILYGAAPMPQALLRKALATFRCGLFQGFGQTEAPPITMLTPADHRAAVEDRPQLLGSVGRKQVGVNLRIVDADGNDVPVGQLGEICVRGPFVMKEYWHAPEQTAATQIDGWHHTGDVGRLDEDGVLYVVDRIKDLIISGGFNVYPREVERVIEQIPQVSRVAVIGMPSDAWGEEVTAVIELVSGEELSADEVMARCRQELAGYKIPKRVEFIDALALNANGKVLKRAVRDQLPRREFRA
jgi:acyl-CoA synthetase (AMP-forming)/AMP-acid ligase II